MKRKGTREAIHHVIEHLDANVTTSGAVRFSEDVHPDIKGRYIIKVWSYGMCIAAIHWGYREVGKPTPSQQIKKTAIVAYVNRKKRSVTTSKHQGWTHGAIHRYLACPQVLTDMTDGVRDAVAAEYAMENGVGEIDAVKFLERGGNG